MTISNLFMCIENLSDSLWLAYWVNKKVNRKDFSWLVGLVLIGFDLELP